MVLPAQRVWLVGQAHRAQLQFVQQLVCLEHAQHPADATATPVIRHANCN